VSTSTYLDASAEVARIAGNIALGYYGQHVAIEKKSDGTPVTPADRAAEMAAREWIDKRFSHDGIIGEEFPDVRPESERQWIIDPIDATKSFVRDVPLWGTLVAVMEGTEIIAGAAFFPALSELIVAASGLGCWWNDSRARASHISAVADATVLTSQAPFSDDPVLNRRWETLERGAAVSRTWGDCFGYLMVATGRAEVMADPVVSVWDVAAFYPIITEAGGVITDMKGSSAPFGGSALATNAAVSDTVRGVLIETAPQREDT
jgi:histidinol phosphatase-like enzyme (inositol monophosphatase family)